jgi:hypothetical protein
MDDDGDIVRGLGFVTLHASYLEEQIESLIALLDVHKKYSGGWQISGKIKHAKSVVSDLDSERFSGLIADLDTCLQIFEDRNALVHGRIYSGLSRPDTLKSSRPNVQDKVVSSSDLYQLANEMSEFRSAIYRPMIIELPKALNSVLESKA